jgi:hypothetical protein
MRIEANDLMEIYNLLSSYADILDFNRLDELDQFITDDFRYDMSDLQLPDFVGLAQTKVALSQATNYFAHVVCNPRITSYSGDRAKVSSRCIGVIQSGLSDAAHYEDDMVKTAKGWRIQHRKIVVIKNGATISMDLLNQTARPHQTKL